jgi:hypothetical protein
MMKKQDVKLRPCPVCGEDKDLRYSKTSQAVECLTCCAMGPLLNTKAEAIAAWNIRPGEDALVGALKAIYDCWGVSTSSEIFARNVKDFIEKDAKAALRGAGVDNEG